VGVVTELSGLDREGGGGGDCWLAMPKEAKSGDPASGPKVECPGMPKVLQKKRLLVVEYVAVLWEGDEMVERQSAGACRAAGTTASTRAGRK
jgi:hypothetical protein